MRCVVCERFSWRLICPACLDALSAPPVLRKLDCGLDVLSFYRFDEIDWLLHGKYQPIGSTLYRHLARNAFRPFGKNFDHPTPCYAVGIDETTTKGYAHTAILSRALRSANIRPIYSKLLAKNKLSYAGKSLTFRKANPREFSYTGPTDREIILVDDVVTTGTTLCEAKASVESSGGQVAFALTLADARDSSPIIDKAYD